MKPVWPLLLVICTLPACDKVRQAHQQRAKTSPAAASVASPTAARGELVRDLSADEFQSFTEQPGVLAIVDFHAHWCGPCRKLAPILEKLAAEHQGRVRIGKINVDQNRELAAKLGVNGIPDVRIFRDGKQVDQFVGLPPENHVRSLIESHAKGLSAVTPSTDGEAEAAKPAEPSIQPMTKDWLPPGMERR